MLSQATNSQPQPNLRRQALWAMALFMALVTAVLIGSGVQRYRDIQANDRTRAHDALRGAVSEIVSYIENQRRLVQLFALQNRALVDRVASHPDGGGAYDLLEARAGEFFPDLFTFTIINSDLEPVAPDYEGRVGERCQADIRRFVTDQRGYRPEIHPSSLGYHFDIMVNLAPDASPARTFFVSFLPQRLSAILAHHSSADHRLVLVHRHDPDLIEVTGDGDRSRRGDSPRLDPRRVDAVANALEVPGTRWRLQALGDARPLGRELTGLLTGYVSLGIAFLLLAGTILRLLARAERQLIQARQDARAADCAKSRFLSAMTGEFRAPLSHAIDGIEALQDTPLSQRQRGHVEKALKHGNRLLNLLDDMLDLAHVEGHRHALDDVEFDLRGLIEAVAEYQHGRAEKKGLELLVRYDPNLPRRVRGDATRLRQVLLNLTDNAIKFTERGFVLISARQLRRCAQSVSIRLVVEDTGIGMEPQQIPHCSKSSKQCGIGMEPQQIPHCFELFEQADNNANEGGDGAGIGLALCKHIVGQMGGLIGAESSPGKGATFWLRLTLAALADTQAPRSPAFTDSKPPHLLVIDDLPVRRTLIDHYFTAEGLSCTARDGRQPPTRLLHQLLEQGQATNGLVLAADARSFDALDVVRTLRGQAEFEGLSIVVVASHLPPAWQSLHVIRLGKPLGPSRLDAALAELIGQQRTTVDPPAIPAQRIGPPLDDTRVLLISNDPVERSITEGMLRALHCVPVCADDARESLHAFADQPFDVIMLDCETPGNDDWHLVRRLHALEGERHHTPMVLLSGPSRPGEQAVWLKAGVDAFLIRPITPVTLHNALMHCLHGEAETAVASS